MCVVSSAIAYQGAARARSPSLILPRSVSRERAYELVQRNAMRAFHDARDFKELLLADADVTAVLPPADVERAFDLNEQLRHVDVIFDRVFTHATAGV